MRHIHAAPQRPYFHATLAYGLITVFGSMIWPVSELWNAQAVTQAAGLPKGDSVLNSLLKAILDGSWNWSAAHHRRPALQRNQMMFGDKRAGSTP